ncbi:hypothetical protein AOQ84DRAFT_58658 [Glonium stellatum]|uniref:Uncharacterized protein n=1 Tax=Glonium stellatum TaxID=574774 RepID=A0A8E2EYX7_9PEZI|nr:hypothetical protein AOQ84DRAFT_58658 [Glonium stellatum]
MVPGEEEAPAGVSTLYTSTLEQDMMRPSFDAPAWLRGLVSLKVEGTRLFRAGEVRAAAELFLSAVIALQTMWRVRGEEMVELEEGFARDVSLLRWQCEINLALCGLQLGGGGSGDGLLDSEKGAEKKESDKEREVNNNTNKNENDKPQETPLETAHRLHAAEVAAQNALDICLAKTPSPWQRGGAEFAPPNTADWYTDEQKAKAWFRLAAVHIQLREFLFAAGELERAQRLAPNDREIDQAFREVRERIDFSVRPGKSLERVAAMARKWEEGLSGGV